MESLTYLVKALDAAYWEFNESVRGLSDDVWKRADPNLLSVGELITHIFYWEAKSFLGDDLESAFAVDASRYYDVTRDEQFVLDTDADSLIAEAKRIHEMCLEAIRSSSLQYDDPNSYREGWTWGYTLIYQAFHLSYHTGQIYSVRHLLGHETFDN